MDKRFQEIYAVTQSILQAMREYDRGDRWRLELCDFEDAIGKLMALNNRQIAEMNEWVTNRKMAAK